MAFQRCRGQGKASFLIGFHPRNGAGGDQRQVRRLGKSW